jgi:hypothetical protein
LIGSTGTYSAVRVIVEYMDGEIRSFGPVGGSVVSPKITGDGSNAVLLEMMVKTGQGARIEHVASVPLVNIRTYRLEPWS